jgi:hypothetical protein
LTARGGLAAAFSTLLAVSPWRKSHHVVLLLLVFFVPSALLKFVQPAKRYIIGSSLEQSPSRVEKKTGAFASASR